MLENINVYVVNHVKYCESSSRWSHTEYKLLTDERYCCEKDQSGTLKYMTESAEPITLGIAGRLYNDIMANKYLIYTPQAIEQANDLIEQYDLIDMSFPDKINTRYMKVSYENEMAIRISKIKSMITYDPSTNSLQETTSTDGYVILDLVNGTKAYKLSRGTEVPVEPITMLKMSDKNMFWTYENAVDLITFFNRPELTRFRNCSKIMSLLTGIKFANVEGNPNNNIVFRAYVLALSSYPQMEIVYKMGMGHILQSLLTTILTSQVNQVKTMICDIGKLIDIEKTEGKKMFRLPKYILNYLTANRSSIQEYLGWADIYALTNITEKDFNEFIDNGYLLYLASSMTWWETKTVYNELLSVLKYGYSLNKLAKYLMKEKSTLHFLYDYLTMSEFCGLEYELYPQHLEKRHDQVVKYNIAKKNEANNKALDDLAANINKILTDEEANNKTLSVVIPRSVQDYIDEGNAMRNCMGGYYNDTLNGRSLIFFIRHTNDISEPYIDAEFRVGHGLGQLYYKCNIAVTQQSERIFANKICSILQKSINNGTLRLAK